MLIDVCLAPFLMNHIWAAHSRGLAVATIEEQLKEIQAEIDKTQKNKATMHHIGKLKAKIAKLKIQREKTIAHQKASGPAKGFEVKKSGDVTFDIVFFPIVVN